MPRQFLSEQLTKAEVQKHWVKMWAFEKANSSAGKDFPQVIIRGNGSLVATHNYLDASFCEYENLSEESAGKQVSGYTALPGNTATEGVFIFS